MNESLLESGRGRYRDDPEDDIEDDPTRHLAGTVYDGEGGIHDEEPSADADLGTDSGSNEYDSGGQTPITYRRRSSDPSSRSESQTRLPKDPVKLRANGNAVPPPNGHLTSFPNVENTENESSKSSLRTIVEKITNRITTPATGACQRLGAFLDRAFKKLPLPVQKILSKLGAAIVRFAKGLYEFMNPPLWAMLVAIIIASVPSLQSLFFDEGTFIRNSVTRAVEQSGGVAVPLILVVLGANLARNTLPENANEGVESKAEERNLLIAALVSRMLLPTIIMLPILAIVAKYVPVSIVDDKIFIIVCFLLTGAPSALQLAQICQVNNVYMSVMSKLLFQSYVVWILPSTLVLVLCALEVVEWAER